VSDPTGGALRWTRSAVLTVVLLALAATAHVLAGGNLPSPLVLSSIAVATTCATFAVTRFRMGRLGALGLLGTGELLLHLVFETFGAAAGVTSGVVTATGHHHEVVRFASVDTLTDPGTSMIAAHVAATVVTALLVAHGERLLGNLLSWLAPLARVLELAVPVVTGGPRPRRPERPARRPHTLVLVQDRPRRGPPEALPRS
jgi:hypothetical protein